MILFWLLVPLAWIFITFFMTFVPGLASTDSLNAITAGVDHLGTVLAGGVFPLAYLFTPGLLSICVGLFLAVYGFEYAWGTLWFVFSKIPFLNKIIHKNGGR